MSDNTFYVYEHWRPDTDVCFYVGKGRNRRAYKFDRGGYHGHVLKKLARLGFAAEVRIVAGGLSEAEAFALERERIAFWRGSGVKLTNRTDGGDGTAGYKFTKAQRTKLQKSMTGKQASNVTREKMRKARAGRNWSEKTKTKMRESAKRVQSEARKRYCATPAGKVQMQRLAAKAGQDRKGRSERALALWRDPAYRERVLKARGVSG